MGAAIGGAGGRGVASSVIDGTDADLSDREAALSRWCRQVVRDPNVTTDGDVDLLRQAGLSDREIFEATAWIAFRLAFSTLNAALGAVPDRQLAELTPPRVRAAVTFGRSAPSAP
ncbi:carboxymuconolactone decarboxylase family protein [Fodinicola feengrottensis]|uniref:carboxymuconolactone decarboxylase family protein n=1 Tax=Fodinicola feengrottensis TaxID=435914 RepID=UPI002442D366|nr:hypothetical protein [Fodinicola feengrottensis]